MSSKNRSAGKVSLDDLTVDGRSLKQRPKDLNTMTLDERDNGLYRDKLHASQSTYDPFQASHSDAALAEGLSSSRVGRRRFLGWIFLVIPCALFGGLGSAMEWDNIAAGTSGYLKATGMAVLWWLPTIFWIYVIHRRRPAR